MREEENAIASVGTASGVDLGQLPDDGIVSVDNMLDSTWQAPIAPPLGLI